MPATFMRFWLALKSFSRVGNMAMLLLVIRCALKMLYVLPVSGQQRKENGEPVKGVNDTLNLGVGWEP